jgi:hypothetical protein
MFDPSTTVTIGQVISTLKDLGFIVGTGVVGWKARDLFQPAVDFFKRAVDHMDIMESGVKSLQMDMNTLLTNHLSHVEADLKVISGRITNHVVALEDADPPSEK